MALTLNGTEGIQFNDSSLQPAAASPYGLKNRIINGDMVIDQRRAGASVSVQTSTGYTLDRWTAVTNQNSKYSVQQNAGSVTPPSGFTNYLGVTSSSAYTVTSGDYMFLAQYIEGYNVADLDFGKATAKTITISFWVRSSLTGTFGGVIGNGDQNRTYPFSYTISSANTWEQKTITIAGDTTGTWVTNNNTGLAIRFGLGVGSTYLGTANAWSSSQLFSVTGATNVVATNGATWYVTGVQLERNTTATPFEWIPYGTELALCQRYAIRFGGDQIYELIGSGFVESSTSSLLLMPLPVFMRSSPSVSFSTLRIVELNGAAVTVTGVSTKGIESGNKVAFLNPVVASGLTTGRVCWVSANNSTSASLLLSAEL